MSYKSFVKSLMPTGLYRTVEPFGHLAEAWLDETLAGYPAKDLKVIGVTGTNGKTTSCFLIHNMLTSAGYKSGLLSTVAYGVGNDLHEQMEHVTTLSPKQLITRINKMRAQGIEYLVLETTSHALAQHRVFGVPYSVVAMTNITHEHLDYHGTFQRYVQAKLRLFKLANKNKKGLQVGIANAEDPNGQLFANNIKKSITYGINKGDLRAIDVKLSPSSVDYVAKIGGDSYKIHCNIPGSFNVYNSLLAVGVGRAIGLTKKQIEQGISNLDSVEGRMTRIDEGQDFTVIVDFAHTPDSFEKLFKDMRPIVKGKMIVMFGSAGHRDEAKRAIQGELAGKYADEVIITEEDDRDVDGKEIMDQIAGGAEKAGKVLDKDLFLILDRPSAIKFAIGQAKKGDTVLLLGKGHEKTIERADGAHPWNEIKEAHKALKELTKNY